MQLDMHYYATFFLAEYANIPLEDVRRIAYAAQYVDDSTKYDSNQHKDGGLLYGIASAHHPLDCVKNRLINGEEQRRVWVPFHFLPGGSGNTFGKKLICMKNSKIANEMFRNHIENNINKEYQVYLIGVASHVFMDTFSHYGFSGISSKYNSVKENSIIPHVKNEKLKKYILGKKGKFLKDFGLEKVARFLAEYATSALGHGGAMTFPDRPYLHWELEFVEKHSNHEEMINRKNKETFLEGCQALYYYLSEFAKKKYKIDSPDFDTTKKEIENILAFEGTKIERISKWKNIIKANNIDYDPNIWEEEKNNFNKYEYSKYGIEANVYRFHQAVSYHRYYILKDLLPKHEIAVY